MFKPISDILEKDILFNLFKQKYHYEIIYVLTN